jgi:hypothetical protein
VYAPCGAEAGVLNGCRKIIQRTRGAVIVGARIFLPVRGFALYWTRQEARFGC